MPVSAVRERITSPSMATTAAPARPASCRQLARDHLWLHFTRMGGDHAEVPVIVRGDGCYLEDANGKRYLDALAGLFSVNLGYGFGEEMGQAALEQMRELPFYTNWSYSHPRAIELAAEVASLAPGDLNRVFFVSGGSEAVESAWKLARQYYLRAAARTSSRASTRRSRAAPPTTARPSARSRSTASPELRNPFEPLVPEVRHVRNTNRYHRPPDETEAEFTALLLDDLETTILAMGPETVCLVHMEPVQNAGGAFTPPEGYWRGVRELCDRYDILLSADEVITGFGRVGHWFASERYDIRPDIVCCAKGLSSSYAAIGAVRRNRPCDGAVPRRLGDVLARDHLRRPSGDVRDRAQEHRDHEARANHGARARATRTTSARRWRSSWTCRSAATCAERVTSTRSSSSRTRRRARRSTTRSARRCCAAFSRLRCSSGA